MACKRSPVRSRYSPPLAQIRVTNTVDFKSKSTVFLCLSASKFIAILQILCKIKVEVHMDLVFAINVYPADKLADNHLFCFKAGTIVQVCIRNQFFVQLRYGTIGTEDVKYGLSKGKWEVEFTGIATAANGDMYSVVDGATLAFSVTK